MAIREKLRIDDRFSWSFTGVVIAVIFGAIGLYAIFHENRPNLVYEIENRSDVLDLHRPLPDLTLAFRGQDIQQQNLNLRIFTVRISNRGRVDILQSHYDQDTTWGITVKPGQIIEVRLGATNSTYLASRIGPEITGPNMITLRKVIFEHDRFVTFDILVLHHKESPPRIGSFGKIAGLDEITVADASAQRGGPGFWYQVVSGTPLVHIMRFIAYLLGLVAFAFGIAGVVGLAGRIQKARRRRRVATILGASPKESKALQILKDSYVENGIGVLKGIQRALKDEKRLRRAIKRQNHVQRPATRETTHGELLDPFASDVGYSESAAVGSGWIMTPDGVLVERALGVPKAIFSLLDEGLVRLSPEGKPEVDPELNDTLDELTNVLK